MNTAETRREHILQMLKEQKTPLSGAALARMLGVTRQIIVQDIALIRAENHPILSTNKGYVYRAAGSGPAQPRRVLCVKHATEDVLTEFLTVLNLGGKILDVAVEHELYGEIRADLQIETAQEAQDFADRLACCRDNPLKVLTDDCHYHTIAAPSDTLLDLIEAALREKGFLSP